MYEAGFQWICDAFNEDAIILIYKLGRFAGSGGGQNPFFVVVVIVVVVVVFKIIFFMECSYFGPKLSGLVNQPKKENYSHKVL